MITIDDVLTYDQLFLRCKQLEAEIEFAKGVLLEANLEVIRARSLLLAQGQMNAHGLKSVEWGDSHASS